LLNPQREILANDDKLNKTENQKEINDEFNFFKERTGCTVWIIKN
jgi:hypothetical protein